MDIFMAHEKAKRAFCEMVVLFCRRSSKHEKVLARGMGVSRSTVKRWRSGKNAPHPSMHPAVYEFVGNHRCTCDE